MMYWCWWHGKTPEIPYATQNGVRVGGKIVDVQYIGNAMRGGVLLTFENGTNYMVAPVETSVYRPRKSDLKIIHDSADVD